MKKNKKEKKKKKKEKLQIQKSLQEQIAKNAEDNKNISEGMLISNFSQNKMINKNLNKENKVEKYINKFDFQYSEMNDYYNDFESREDSKDSTNELNLSKEYLETDSNYNLPESNKNNKINKFNQPKKTKKKQGPFKSTAADFKVKYKTELCKYYEINGFCKYGDCCAYAHGKENLRSKVTNTTAYRTKKCVQFFENGYCPYGNRCQFAHQITTNIINNPYDRKMTYKKTLETISKFENIGNIKELIEKPRLSIFKEIYENKDSIKSTLFEDIKKIGKEGIFERIDDE